MNEKANSVIKTVPAASALHQVPLFDPLKLLRKTTSLKTGEKVLKLDLRYKKMWFKLVHPRGRILTNTLRITDQMAIFEAQLFADRNDTTALSQFTSCHTRSESGSQYIRNAQDEALNEALDNAGFGIQLADLVEGGENGYGSEVLLSQVEALLRKPIQEAPPKQPPQPVEVQKKAPVSAPVQIAATPPAQTAAPQPVKQGLPSAPISAPTIHIAQPAAESGSVSQTEPCPTVSESLEVTTRKAEEAIVPDVEPASDIPAVNAVAETADVLQMLGGIPTVEESAGEPAAAPEQHERATVVDFPHEVKTSAASETNAATESLPTADPYPGASATYTEDMSVEEIRQRMTYEQAIALTVTFGPNKGRTLGEVLDRRPSSLKFYAHVSPDASNILKAGAFLLLDEISQARAG